MHDLVDFVSDEAEIAGRGAAAFVSGENLPHDTVNVENGNLINYVLPQKLDKIIATGNIE